MQQLIVFAGLPCTGKSTIADEVGRQLAIPVFAKDWLEATLRRSRLQPSAPDGQGSTGHAAYELLTTLAERQLKLGLSVILDSVATTETIRDTWRGLAAGHGATWNVIECICSDRAAHRARIETRNRGIPGWTEPRWEDVERIAANYAPWTEPRLVLDAMDSLAGNVTVVICALQHDG
jgi:predicted kinase